MFITKEILRKVLLHNEGPDGIEVHIDAMGIHDPRDARVSLDNFTEVFSCGHTMQRGVGDEHGHRTVVTYAWECGHCEMWKFKKDVSDQLKELKDDNARKI